VLLPLRIKFENIESILRINLSFQLDSVCDLILLFNQIQLFLYSRVILELVLSYLEQHLDHVLRSLIDIGFVQNVSKLIKDYVRNRALHLLHVLSNLTAEADRDLNTVVCRLVEQEEQNLARKHFVLDLLVDKMREESSRREANCLVISLESFSELKNQTADKKLSDLR